MPHELTELRLNAVTRPASRPVHEITADVCVVGAGIAGCSAAIESAEIRGRFEGTLTVRKRLFIRATGQVTGTIRYGQIEVERGGRIAGDIEAMGESERPD